MIRTIDGHLMSMSRCAVIRRMSSYGAHQPAAGHVSGNADISVTSLAIQMQQQQLAIDLYFMCKKLELLQRGGK